MSHRAIIDTNVLVSGLGWAGPPAALLDAIFDGRIQLVTSPALLDELGRVLEYRRLAQVLTKTGMTAHALVDLVAAVSTVVIPRRVSPPRAMPATIACWRRRWPEMQRWSSAVTTTSSHCEHSRESRSSPRPRH
jgi:putative PIN family toxin of toxin-antitoxin system